MANLTRQMPALDQVHFYKCHSYIFNQIHSKKRFKAIFFGCRNERSLII